MTGNRCEQDFGFPSKEFLTLLSQLGLSLLDRGHNHITDTGCRQSVQSGANALDGYDVKISCS
jgi:hypothetical protein